MDLRLHEEEEEGGSVWQKCSKHNLSKRRFLCGGGGVCPFCLRERLSSLCPECAKNLPCSCSSRATVSASKVDDPFAGIGSVGRVANLIESEPAFRRSMSVPFLWSAKPELKSETGSNLKPVRGRSLWRLLLGNKGETKTKDAASTVMRKCRSVAVSDAGEVEYSPATSKGSGWYFPSPIKVFRQSKVMFQQRSPLYRG